MAKFKKKDAGMERGTKNDGRRQKIVSEFSKEDLHECHERFSPCPQNAKYSSVSKGYDDKQRLL
jgi:hypothetical protein